MGLSIRAYTNLAETTETDVSYSASEDRTITFYSVGYTEVNFPGRTKGLKPDTPYKYDEELDFHAGSYSGYNRWRDLLARMAGYDSAEAVWSDTKPGPFTELINFSDCEGVIGPITAAKLARDFSEFADTARAFADTLGVEGEYWLWKFGEWRKVFEKTAGNGAVEFF